MSPDPSADPSPDPAPDPSGDPRPSDLDALLDAISKALSLPPEDVAKAFEAGQAEINLIEDTDGRRAVGVRIGEHRGVVALGRPE